MSIMIDVRAHMSLAQEDRVRIRADLDAFFKDVAKHIAATPCGGHFDV
jgi:hypothetical protein